MNVLAAIAESTANDNAAALDTWRDDVRAEGDTVEDLIIPAGTHVLDMLDHVWARTSDHVQFFGPVPVPQVRQTPDGHGFRLGGCFAPAGTKDGTGWGWDDAQQGFVGLTQNSANWPSDAVRGVSSLWFEGLTAIPDKPADLMNRWLGYNHAYRTGQRSYGRKAIKVDYLDFADSGVGLRLDTTLTALVGAANIVNGNAATIADEDHWFALHANEVYEIAAHYGGGIPFWPGIYYLDRDAGYASGKCIILGMLMFCSYGWQVDTYPLQRYAAAGGVQWVWYDPWANNLISNWDAETPIAQVARTAHTLGSLQLSCLTGDGTLRRHGYTENDMDPRVDGLLTRVSALETGLATLQRGAPPPPSIIVTLAHNRQVLHPEFFRDDTSAVQALVNAGKPWQVFPGLSDPFPGIVKELLVQWTRDGVAHERVFSQFEQVVLA